MVKFGKAIATQANPAWANEYVSYKKLRTIIKRLVYIWHAGKLASALVQYDPDHPPIAYDPLELRAPKMPNDDSDYESEDDLEGPGSSKAEKRSLRPSEKHKQVKSGGVSKGVAGKPIGSDDSDNEAEVANDSTRLLHRSQQHRVLHPSSQQRSAGGPTNYHSLGETTGASSTSTSTASSHPPLHPVHHPHAHSHAQHAPVSLLGSINEGSFTPVPVIASTTATNTTATALSSTSNGTGQSPSVNPSNSSPSVFTRLPPLRPSLSFASLQALFSSSNANVEDSNVNPSTPNTAAAAAAAAASPTLEARRQQEALATYTQYQADFWDSLKADFDKVESFYQSRIAECLVEMSHLSHDGGSYRHRAPGLARQPSDVPTSHGRDEARYGSLLSLYETLCDLRLYCNLNLMAFRKILKKFEKYSPQLRRPTGAMVSVTAVPCAKFMRKVKTSGFALQEDLTSMIQQMNQLVARDKLVAIETQVKTKRSNERKGSLFTHVKPIPVIVSFLLFFFILSVPIHLELKNQVNSPVPVPATMARINADAGAGNGGVVNSTGFIPPATPVHLQLAPSTNSRFVNMLTTMMMLPSTPSSSYKSAAGTAADKIDVHVSTSTPLPPSSSSSSISSPPNSSSSPSPSSSSSSSSGVPHKSRNHNIRAHRCLALLVLAISLWVTEAIPYFCTAMLIPVLVVLLDLAVDPVTKVVLGRKQAANYVAGHMFDHTSLLVLLGFAISAACCKAQLELRIASKFQAHLGRKPQLFLLGIMLLGLFLSMWLNNHTAPILCVAFLTPIMQDFKRDSRFNKALMIGLAFACNFGGMASPIASLQNIVAVATLSKFGIDISFGQWLLVALPLSVIGVVLCWLYIIVTIKPDDVDEIAVIAYDKQPMNTLHWLVISLSSTAIFVLAAMSMFEPIVGSVATISLAYLVCVFSLGILNVVDFNSFNWHLLILIGGGSVLGDSIKSSQLLDIIAETVLGLLYGTDQVAYLQLVFIVIIITSCISHTVGALILMPLLVRLGVDLEMPVVLTLSCAFAISGAMALPFSSFPNLNGALVCDDLGEPYLQATDIVKAGVPFTLVTYLILITIGQFLIWLFLPSGVAASLQAVGR